MFWFRYVPTPPTTDRSIRPQILDVCRGVPEHKMESRNTTKCISDWKLNLNVIQEIMK